MIFRLIMLLFFTTLSLLIAACAQPQPTRIPEEPNITWPQPPEEPRIRYVHSFGRPEDLGIRPSTFRRFMDAFAGTKDTGMVRPYAIATYQQKILVADPGLHAVHVFDRANNTYLLISTVEDEPLISPVGVALSKNRIFVADSTLGKVFILDERGDLLVSITDFERPTGLAFDDQTNRLFVADTLAHRIEVFDPEGQHLFKFGKRGINNAEFNFPSHISVANGILLVNDNMNFKIRRFDMDGHPLSSFGSHGDGSGAISQPKGVATDSKGNIYVAGATIDRIQVFSVKGEFLLAFGSSGRNPGEFIMPTGVTINNDKIYVADSLNRRVQVFRFIGEN